MPAKLDMPEEKKTIKINRPQIREKKSLQEWCDNLNQ